ncbi:hypothetical protein RNN40_13245, partial [Escherichia coli]|nr:hypothetical protein [Escherichia coli]
KSAQLREILISESAWEEMTCLFAPSLVLYFTHLGLIYYYTQQCNICQYFWCFYFRGSCQVCDQ